MATNVGSIYYELDLDTKKFMSKAGDSAKKAGKAIAIGIGAAAAAVTAFGVSSIKSFSEAQKATAQTNAVLKSTKKAAGMSAKAIGDLATKFQKTTPYADEVVQSAENMLLTFTKIGKDVFPDTTGAVLDMATAMGTDLQSTAIQVGKALQDPVRGVTALQRVGVRLSETQKKQVEDFVAVNDIASAQKIILQELQTEFGGSAKAAGETFAGKLEILKNNFDNVKESIGEVLVNALSPLMSKISNFVSSDKFQQWVKDLNTWLGTYLPPAITYLSEELFPALWEIIKKLAPVIGDVVKGFADITIWFSENEWALWGIVGVFIAIKTAMLLKGAAAAFKIAIGIASGSYAGLAAAMASPLILAVSVAAALAAIGLVIAKATEARRAVENAKQAESSLRTINQSILQRGAEVAADKTIDAATKKRWADLVITTKRSMTRGGGGGYASGTIFARGGMTLVGERGPELVNLPRGSKVTPNHELSNSITTTANFTGNIYLNDRSAVDAFFSRLSRNQELAQKGMATL